MKHTVFLIALVGLLAAACAQATSDQPITSQESATEVIVYRAPT